MKIKLKTLDKDGHRALHSDDVADAVALKRMYPKAAIVERGCQGHLVIGDRDRRVVAVFPSNTKAFPTVLYGQAAMIDDIMAAGRGKGL